MTFGLRREDHCSVSRCFPKAALAVRPSGINATNNGNMTLVSRPDSNETLKNPLVAVQQLAVKLKPS